MLSFVTNLMDLLSYSNNCMLPFPKYTKIVCSSNILGMLIVTSVSEKNSESNVALKFLFFFSLLSVLPLCIFSGHNSVIFFILNSVRSNPCPQQLVQLLYFSNFHVYFLNLSKIFVDFFQKVENNIVFVLRRHHVYNFVEFCQFREMV